MQLDAVFSNAVLHWVLDAQGAVHSVANALKPGGRFVAEFGGKGNVQTILRALQQVSGRSDIHPWYFPSVGDYAALLESAGLEVIYAHLFERPTPLGDTGLAGWLEMFCQRFFADLPAQRWQAIVSEVEETAANLYQDGQWFADYRRLRVAAIRQG